MAIGMTYDQYWYGDVCMARAYAEADKERQRRLDEEAWLKGAYVYRAVSAALSVSEFFRGKGQKPLQYPKEPLTYKKEEDPNMRMKAYLDSMIRANKERKRDDGGRNDRPTAN